MKTKILLTFSAVMLAVTMAFAGLPTPPNVPQPGIGYKSYSTVGTPYGTANSITNFAVISDNAATPLSSATLTYFNVTSDRAAAVLQFYASTNQVGAAQGYTNSTTNLFVTSTNGFAANDEILIQHRNTDQYEYAVFFGSGYATNTNVVFAPTGTYTNFTFVFPLCIAPSNAVVPGDIIYQERKVGSIAVGAITNGNAIGRIYTGGVRQPLMGVIVGTTTATINAFSADYQ